MKIKEILEKGIKELKKAEIQESTWKAKQLLKVVLDAQDTFYITHEDDVVIQKKEEEFLKGIEKLKKGTPLQYITKKQYFMKEEFYVDENVLIPQPDTEILVEETIEKIRQIKKLKSNPKEILVLDLCTGSGAIGISLKKNLKEIQLTMSDISKNALEVAKRNAKEILGALEHIHILQSDLFEKIEGEFDVIVSNPPYIKSEVIKELDIEVQKEPILALNGGKSGLDFYKAIIKNAGMYLKTDGFLCLEIGYDQKEEVIGLLKKSEQYIEIEERKDLAGLDRVIIAKRR